MAPEITHNPPSPACYGTSILNSTGPGIAIHASQVERGLSTYLRRTLKIADDIFELTSLTRI
jgi:hypothetical protein